MKTVAILQARLGSTRLPKKVLMDVGGKTILQRVIERTRQALPEIVVATTTLPEDDAIVDACENQGVGIFRGSSQDVLTRYIGAAQMAKADRIIRICCDCPMIDPIVIGKVVDALTPEYDYASNLYPRSYAKGLDCEAFWFDTLLRFDRISEPYEREHVTLAVSRVPHLFRMANVMDNRSVDTLEDLDRVRRLHALL